MNISTREAECILAIVSEGNLTNAAKQLYISQPSLTQMIQKMEKQFGVKLFVREGNHMQLTLAGERFAEVCAMLVKACRDVENELEEISQRHRGRVLLGMPFNLGSYIFPFLYSIYREKYPETKLVPIEGGSSDLEKMLIGGTLDIAITPLPPKNPKLETQLLFDGKMVLSVPKTHWLNKYAVKVEGDRHPRIDIALADGEPFVMSLVGQRARLATEMILKKAGITPKIVFVTKNVETKKRMSAAGFGLAVFPEHYLEFYPVLEGANYYYLKEEYDVPWRVGALYRKDAFFSKSSMECLDILSNLFKNNRPFSINMKI